MKEEEERLADIAKAKTQQEITEKIERERLAAEKRAFDLKDRY